MLCQLMAFCGPFLETPDNFRGPKTILGAQYSPIAILLILNSLRHLPYVVSGNADIRRNRFENMLFWTEYCPSFPKVELISQMYHQK